MPPGLINIKVSGECDCGTVDEVQLASTTIRPELNSGKRVVNSLPASAESANLVSRVRVLARDATPTLSTANDAAIAILNFE